MHKSPIWVEMPNDCSEKREEKGTWKQDNESKAIEKSVIDCVMVWGVQQQQHSPSFSRSLSSDSTLSFLSLSSPVFDVYNATGYLNIAQSTFFSHGISQQLMDVSPSYRHFQMISKREIHLDIYRLVVYRVRVSFFRHSILCLVAFFRPTCKHLGGKCLRFLRTLFLVSLPLVCIDQARRSFPFSTIPRSISRGISFNEKKRKKNLSQQQQQQEQRVDVQSTSWEEFRTGWLAAGRLG